MPPREPRIKKYLESLLSGDSSQQVSALQQIGALKPAEDWLPPLEEALANCTDDLIRFQIAKTRDLVMIKLGRAAAPPGGLAGLEELLRSGCPDPLTLALVLETLPTGEAVMATDLLREHRWQDLPAAVLPSLCRFVKTHGSYADSEALCELCRHPNAKVLTAALDALEQLDPTHLPGLVTPLLASTDAGMRVRAIRCLYRWDKSEAMIQVKRQLLSDQVDHRKAALLNSFFFPYPEIEPVLLQYLSRETRPEMLEMVSLILRTNPHPELPFRLYWICKSLKGDHREQVKRMLLAVIQSLEIAGLIDCTPQVFLDRLKARVKAEELQRLAAMIPAGGLDIPDTPGPGVTSPTPGPSAPAGGGATTTTGPVPAAPPTPPAGAAASATPSGPTQGSPATAGPAASEARATQRAPTGAGSITAPSAGSTAARPPSESAPSAPPGRSPESASGRWSVAATTSPRAGEPAPAPAIPSATPPTGADRRQRTRALIDPIAPPPTSATTEPRATNVTIGAATAAWPGAGPTGSMAATPTTEAGATAPEGADAGPARISAAELEQVRTALRAKKRPPKAQLPTLLTQLGQNGVHEDGMLLRPFLTYDDADVLAAAVGGLARLDPDFIAVYLPQLIQHPQQQVRAQAVMAFCEIDREQIQSLLSSLLGSANAKQRFLGTSAAILVDFALVREPLFAALAREQMPDLVVRMGQVILANPDREAYRTVFRINANARVTVREPMAALLAALGEKVAESLGGITSAEQLLQDETAALSAEEAAKEEARRQAAEAEKKARAEGFVKPRDEVQVAAERKQSRSRVTVIVYLLAAVAWAIMLGYLVITSLF